MTNDFKPGYLKLHTQGLLEERALALRALASPCRLCPRCCGVDRMRGERGFCGAGSRVQVAKALPHMGEEPAISGTRGAGTIFFAHCNLRCCFCQNYQISQEHLGREVSAAELADMMLDLQNRDCHNISLVSAAHFLPGIIDALILAAAGGLSVPLVYNSNGYESPEVLRLLDGIIDIYLPDAKYVSDAAAMRFSEAPGYHRINMAALQEMARQAGSLQTDESDIAVRGLIIRHLVLPEGLTDTYRVLRAIKKNLGPFVTVSLMGQFTPCFEAAGHTVLGRPLSPEENEKACAMLDELGFENGWIQECGPDDRAFVPDFSRQDAWN
ncbi:MAG: radical SAM protein [Deltaproteobacteria bacterium]|nr:radical SAM protein [Deltaproteobacteria bacterium]